MLNGGAGGSGNSGTIRGPLQTITASTVTLNSNASTSNGGARIGGLAQVSAATNLTLTTTGDVALTGGSGSGANLGASAQTTNPVNVNLAINSGGNITLSGGSGGEARIGSPAATVQAGNIAITAAGNITLDNGGGLGGRIRTLGNLAVSGKTISQQSASAFHVGGTSDFNMNGGAITLAGTANDFTGAVSTNGSTVQITDVNALILGSIGATNLTVTANSAVTQITPLTLAGATNINAGTGSITFTNTNNDFTGPVTLTGSTIDIFDRNDLTVNANATGAVRVTGNLNYSGTSGDLTLNALATPVGTLTFGNTVVNGNLLATTADAVSQLAGTTLTVTGASTIDASANNKAITLANAGNDFGGLATLKGSTISVADIAALNAALTGTGLATLNSGGAMTLSGVAAGVTGISGGTMTVASGGLNGGTGRVHLISTGDVILNGDVASTASGESIVLASRFGNFINNFGPAALRVPAAGRFLIYSTSPQLDTLNGLTAPKTGFGVTFDSTFANISFSESGFLYRAGADNLVPAQSLQAASGNGVQGQGNPDFIGTDDPLQIALCMSAGGDAASDQACESVRRNARNIRYRVAIETLRNNPTAADIPLCGPNAPEVCMPVKPGVLSDVALGPPKLDIPATEVRRKVAYLFGNNTYKGTIPQLETPISDVTAIGKVLQERMGYEVTIIKDAGKADMVRTLKTIAETTAQDESVLIFYAGHGYQAEESKAGFWIPSDGSASDPRTWLSNNDVQRFLNRTDAKQIVVVSDSCFSGTLAKEQPLDAPKSALKEDLLTRRAVVTLTSGDEEPVTDEGLDGHSIFAYHFLNEMRRVQKFSPITASYERLRERIVKTYPQTPQLGAVMSAGHMSGASYMFEVK